MEKEELQAALEEAECEIEQEENSVLHAQLQLAQIKQEIHCKISEKEEEFVHYFSVCRKNLYRAIALMLGVRA